MSRTLEQWAPSAANACKTWTDMVKPYDFNFIIGTTVQKLLHMHKSYYFLGQNHTRLNSY